MPPLPQSVVFPQREHLWFFNLSPFKELLKEFVPLSSGRGGKKRLNFQKTKLLLMNAGWVWAASI